MRSWRTSTVRACVTDVLVHALAHERELMRRCMPWVCLLPVIVCIVCVRHALIDVALITRVAAGAACEAQSRCG